MKEEQTSEEGGEGSEEKIMAGEGEKRLCEPIGNILHSKLCSLNYHVHNMGRSTPVYFTTTIYTRLPTLYNIRCEVVNVGFCLYSDTIAIIYNVMSTK
nr:hypothetical protein BgiMline_011542 [Biomphalaria glabrata]